MQVHCSVLRTGGPKAPRMGRRRHPAPSWLPLSPLSLRTGHHLSSTASMLATDAQARMNSSLGFLQSAPGARLTSSHDCDTGHYTNSNDEAARGRDRAMAGAPPARATASDPASMAATRARTDPAPELSGSGSGSGSVSIAATLADTDLEGASGGGGRPPV